VEEGVPITISCELCASKWFATKVLVMLPVKEGEEMTLLKLVGDLTDNFTEAVRPVAALVHFFHFL